MTENALKPSSYLSFWRKQRMTNYKVEKDGCAIDILPANDEEVRDNGLEKDAHGHFQIGRASEESTTKARDSIEEDSQLWISSPSSKNSWTTGIRGTALSLVYFLSMAVVLMFGMNFVHRRMPLSAPILPDLGHEYIPKLSPENLGDRVMTCLIVSFVIAMILNKNRWALLTRFLLTLGNLYILRVVTILVTSLPPTENHCRSDYQEIKNIYWNTLKGLLTLGGGNIHCGDLMFSGHTCMVTNIWITFMINYKNRNLLRAFISALLLATFFFIIATRSHYTADIWIAFWLTIFVHLYTPRTFPFTWRRMGRFIRKL